MEFQHFFVFFQQGSGCPSFGNGIAWEHVWPTPAVPGQLEKLLTPVIEEKYYTVHQVTNTGKECGCPLYDQVIRIIRVEVPSFEEIDGRPSTFER